MMEHSCCSITTSTTNNLNNNATNNKREENPIMNVENLTEALHKTRISTTDTAPITLEETITGDETYEKEQEKTCISRDGDDSSSCASSTGEGGWSSSRNGSQSSDSTRSRTFSIYCVRDLGCDDYDTCSSISTVSNFLRDDEEEISYTSSDDKDDDDDDDPIRIQQTGSQEFLEEVLA